jgi:hypothetical protein
MAWLTTVPPSRVVALPTMRPSRSGVLPWSKMMTASAPASWAFRAFVPKVHVPRWISAMARRVASGGRQAELAREVLLDGSAAGAPGVSG